MTTRVGWLDRRPAAEPELAQPGGGLLFDSLMICFFCWFVGGAFLDAWAHNHLASELETFFTPWHGVLYSGFLASASVLVGAAIRNRLRGCAWRRAVPQGYELSLCAVPLFAAGGLGDMLWHLAFGIETGVDAALSPTHVWPAAAAALFVGGPFRAAWRRPPTSPPPGLLALLPMLISMALTLSTMTLIGQIAHPLVVDVASVRSRYTGNLGLSYGVASIVLQAGLLTGFVLLAVRRWHLPLGSLSLVFAVNAALLSFMRDTYALVPAVALAGLAADLLSAQLRPAISRPLALRLFAAGVPALYYLFYFAALMLTDGIWWTLHAWAGAVALAGVAGLLLSYLLLPPRVPGQ